MARPTKYSDALAAKICSLISEGKSLREICEGKDIPDRRTVHRWLAEKEEFRRLHDIARAEQADFHAEEIINIADTEPDLSRAKLRIDARKWKAARMAPKKWGDKVEAKQAEMVKVDRVTRRIVKTP